MQPAHSRLNLACSIIAFLLAVSAAAIGMRDDGLFAVPGREGGSGLGASHAHTQEISLGREPGPRRRAAMQPHNVPFISALTALVASILGPVVPPAPQI